MGDLIGYYNGVEMSEIAMGTDVGETTTARYTAVETDMVNWVSGTVRTRYGSVEWRRCVVATESDPVGQHLVESSRLGVVKQPTVHLPPRHVLLHGTERFLPHFAVHVHLRTSFISSHFISTECALKREESDPARSTAYCTLQPFRQDS